MRNESQLFVPSSVGNRKQRRHPHRASWLSSCLYYLFEQSPFYAGFQFVVFTYAVYVGILTTYEKQFEVRASMLFYMEFVLFIYSLIEFILRIYASGVRLRYRGFKGKRRFCSEHYLIVDFLLVISYGTVFLFNYLKFFHSSVQFLHALRFLQLNRFIPLDRHIRSIPLITSITYQYRRVLVSAVYLCLLLLLPTAYLLWAVERLIETNGQFFFKTYTDSLWFTINSMATIGYGDTWPQTFIGRTLTATLCCVGVVLWTLPAGIISAGLTSIDEKRRNCERLHEPAARLILAWWRLKAPRNRSRPMLGKQFIARLRYARLTREFRRYRCGVRNEYDKQIRQDIYRILRSLNAMEEKLNSWNGRALDQ